LLLATQAQYGCSGSEAIKRAILDAYAPANAHMQEAEPVRASCAYAPDPEVAMLLRDLAASVKYLIGEVSKLGAKPQTEVAQDNETDETEQPLSDEFKAAVAKARRPPLDWHDEKTRAENAEWEEKMRQLRGIEQ